MSTEIDTIQAEADDTPTDLRKLLILSCPPDETGHKSLQILANKLGITRQSLVKACSKNSISVKRAAQVVDLSEGRTTLADFSPFYLN